jgi:tetratricopeptide (TPR) repeat protein
MRTFVRFLRFGCWGWGLLAAVLYLRGGDDVVPDLQQPAIPMLAELLSMDEAALRDWQGTAYQQALRAGQSRESAEILVTASEAVIRYQRIVPQDIAKALETLHRVRDTLAKLKDGAVIEVTGEMIKLWDEAWIAIDSMNEFREAIAELERALEKLPQSKSEDLLTRAIRELLGNLAPFLEQGSALPNRNDAAILQERIQALPAVQEYRFETEMERIVSGVDPKLHALAGQRQQCVGQAIEANLASAQQGLKELKAESNRASNRAFAGLVRDSASAVAPVAGGNGLSKHPGVYYDVQVNIANQWQIWKGVDIQTATRLLNSANDETAAEHRRFNRIVRTYQSAAPQFEVIKIPQPR